MVLRLVAGILGKVRGWLSRPTRNAPASETGTQEIGPPHDLPDACLRGICLQKWILPERVVDTAAFVPDPPPVPREDGASEVSVNWEDNPEVLTFTLANRATSEHGAARLPRAEIERVSRRSAIDRPLNCERKPELANPYHGNVLFKAGLSKPAQ